jgi:predicted GNAT family acetyltransferase
MGTPPVERNESRLRFEMPTPAGIAWLDYRLIGTTLYLTHAETPRAARGAGFAGQVTRAALEWARSSGFKVVPQCGYVAAYMEQHDEFSDLLL